VTIPDCIDLMKSAFIQLSTGNSTVPIRTGIEHPEYNGTSLFMPVYYPANHQIGIKIVTLFRDNMSKDLPMINGVMLVFDATNGLPLALLDAEFLTSLRTGAASGLATDVLARTDAQIAVLFGAGAQGASQLEAISQVRRLKKVYVFDKDKDKTSRFISKMSQRLPLSIEVSASEEIVKEADIICTATSSAEPVFDAGMIKPGTHINAIGSYKPDKSEIPNETVVESKLIVDSRTAALKEAGEIIQAIQSGKITESHIYAELGELVAGRKPARENNEEITLFKSVGNAVQDIETAHFIIERAREKKIGTEVTL
jgi:ornithine cyclodeaminase/alanine dehydrogenase-like protein (mu-crystallin family)